MFQTMYGRMVVTHDVEVRRIQYDSRRVERGDLFVAIRGTSSDGSRFIPGAIQNGCKVVVTEMDDASDALFMHAGVVKIVVPDARIALARLAQNYFDNPSARMTMVGVTGTNGKTTTTHMIREILAASGIKTGLIGTIRYVIGDESIPATHTTPESLELQDYLHRMAESGCGGAVMEVSSHALHQHRVDGLEFDVRVFTNLTQDHLDYHGSMEEYFAAKQLLFGMPGAGATAVVNADDPWGRKLLGLIAGSKLSYGFSSGCDVSAMNPQLSVGGSTCTILHQGRQTDFTTRLIGRFNLYNILASVATGLALDISPALMRDVIAEMKPVTGRFEQITSPAGWTAVIDYAHTPDALEKALMAIRDVRSASTTGRILTVFGCGGDRDRKKRPLMGEIAARLSDATYVTSDNPRSESPDAIIDDIAGGIGDGREWRRIPDRAAAIRTALHDARRGDVILIAGKGHEEYQITGAQRSHFSDREQVEEFIRTTA
jgi:UDP-N-acetylmuramoyl-L-alanyl-D-glutamate--2,6-diaminopimelate ligase